jgi:uncharacterized protein
VRLVFTRLSKTKHCEPNTANWVCLLCYLEMQDEIHTENEVDRLKVMVSDLSRRLKNAQLTIESERTIAKNATLQANLYRQKLGQVSHMLRLESAKSFNIETKNMQLLEAKRFEANKEKASEMHQQLRLDEVDHWITKNKKEPLKLQRLRKNVAALENEQESQKKLLQEMSEIGQLNESLSTAAQLGDLTKCSLLLKAGAWVNYVDAAGYLPIHYACSNGFFDVVKLCLEFGADHSSFISGHAPVVVAASKGHTHIVSLLLSFGANVEDKGSGRCPASIAALTNGHFETFAFLLNEGDADPCSADANENTALHVAVRLKEQDKALQTIDFLLEKGIDQSLVNRKGHTALQVALYDQNKVIARALGAVINADGEYRDAGIAATGTGTTADHAASGGTDVNNNMGSAESSVCEDGANRSVRLNRATNKSRKGDSAAVLSSSSSYVRLDTNGRSAATAGGPSGPSGPSGATTMKNSSSRMRTAPASLAPPPPSAATGMADTPAAGAAGAAAKQFNEAGSSRIGSATRGAERSGQKEGDGASSASSQQLLLGRMVGQLGASKIRGLGQGQGQAFGDDSARQGPLAVVVAEAERGAAVAAAAPTAVGAVDGGAREDGVGEKEVKSTVVAVQQQPVSLKASLGSSKLIVGRGRSSATKPAAGAPGVRAGVDPKSSNNGQGLASRNQTSNTVSSNVGNTFEGSGSAFIPATTAKSVNSAIVSKHAPPSATAPDAVAIAVVQAPRNTEAPGAAAADADAGSVMEMEFIADMDPSSNLGGMHDSQSVISAVTFDTARIHEHR